MCMSFFSTAISFCLNCVLSLLLYLACLLMDFVHSCNHACRLYMSTSTESMGIISERIFFYSLLSLPMMMTTMPQYVDFRFNLRIRGKMHFPFFIIHFFVWNIWIALRVFIFDFEEHMLHKTCRICSSVFINRSLSVANSRLSFLPSPVYHFRFFNFSVA